jgi:hypothetical protein
MDPWIENPDLWPDFHNSLITAIRDTLNPLVIPRYVVRVESRTTVLTGLDVDQLYRPDVAVRVVSPTAPALEGGVAVLERVVAKPFQVVVPLAEDEIEETFLSILEVPGRKLVTTIEVLSPTNKKTKDARAEYLDKRRNLIRSGVNFVEIDLLRAGEPMPLRDSPPPSDYRILICRRRMSRAADLYGFFYTDPIPSIAIPLLPEDAEPTLDLNAVLHALMDRARYDLSIDYHQPPMPPLRPEDKSWAAKIVAQATETTHGPAAGTGAQP